ncbi:MAG: TetR/AcrR family transcriptional regulator [Acidobacteriaceae bacterium]
MTSVSPQTKGRHSERRQETLTKLLIAAEEVFVKDGYESAQLDDIAARASRSKGAVYTHFKSKEDLFLGLIESRINTYLEGYTKQVLSERTPTERLNAYRKFYASLINDTSYHILSLEFKLFAFRHPEWKDRFTKEFDAMTKAHHGSFESDLKRLPKSKSIEIRAHSMALGPIVNSLVLESFFQPDVLSNGALREILLRIFDTLIVPY